MRRFANFFLNVFYFFKHWFCYFRYKKNKNRIAESGLEIVDSDVKYPDGTRLVGKSSRTMNFVLVEVEPCQRTVLFVDRPVRLNFPYAYFLVRYETFRPCRGVELFRFSSLRLCFSKIPLIESGQLIGKIPISNYLNGWFDYCLGTASPEFDISSGSGYKSVKELAERVISGFWQSSFQMHSSSVKVWEYHSKYLKYKDEINITMPLNHMIYGPGENGNVRLKQYKYTGPEEPTVSIPSPSGISTNHKKRIRKRHRQSSSGQT